MCLTHIIWMVNEATRSFHQFSLTLVVLNKENCYGPEACVGNYNARPRHAHR